MYYRTLREIIKVEQVAAIKYVSVPDEVFRRLLAGAIKSKGIFDEEFYVEKYQDVKAAVTAGIIKSGLEHYLTSGYYESRLPARLLVDERFYLRENPDVVAAIKNKEIESAQAHFDSAGFIENRSPYEGFSIF
jgi:hypothetical protein